MFARLLCGSTRGFKKQEEHELRLEIGALKKKIGDADASLLRGAPALDGKATLLQLRKELNRLDAVYNAHLVSLERDFAGNDVKVEDLKLLLGDESDHKLQWRMKGSYQSAGPSDEGRRTKRKVAELLQLCECAPELEGVSSGQSAQDVPPFFAEVLDELSKHQHELGGLLNFSNCPHISHKIKQKDFANSYTDYEYIYLTVLGFAALHQHCEEIVRQNNAQNFRQNPGTRMLESLCGMTMHGNREGSNTLLRTASPTLIQAFAVAKQDGDFLTFFHEAFDRQSDPCLEGRVEKLMRYLEARTLCNVSGQPEWEDMSLRPLLPTAGPEDIVGEHLRVFMNECTWSWGCQTGLTYNVAKDARTNESNAVDFARFYNATTFEHALRARGVVAEVGSSQWEVMTTESGEWQAYDHAAHARICAAQQQGLSKLSLKLGPRGWTYEINLDAHVQRNPQTGKERPIRCAPATGRRPGSVTEEEMKSAIAFFLEMETLSRAP